MHQKENGWLTASSFECSVHTSGAAHPLSTLSFTLWSSRRHPCAFAGHQVGSRHEESCGPPDSFHGEGEGGDDGAVGFERGKGRSPPQRSNALSDALRFSHILFLVGLPCDRIVKFSLMQFECSRCPVNQSLCVFGWNNTAENAAWSSRISCLFLWKKNDTSKRENCWIGSSCERQRQRHLDTPTLPCFTLFALPWIKAVLKLRRIK